MCEVGVGVHYPFGNIAFSSSERFQVARWLWKQVPLLSAAYHWIDFYLKFLTLQVFERAMEMHMLQTSISNAQHKVQPDVFRSSPT